MAKKRQVLKFIGPRQVRLEDEALPALQPNEALIVTLCSGISAGSELLVYRGEAPSTLAADTTIKALGGTLNFPLKYGYASVGLVTEVGSPQHSEWVGKRVFSFNPHQTASIAVIDSLIALPDALSSEQATLLPNMETAVSFAMDVRPILGERAIVFGLGVVGLLTTWLLVQHPLADLVGVDRFGWRRTVASELGASAVVESVNKSNIEFDFALELTGNPAALNDAVQAVGYAGRVLIGSWYGTKAASLELGGAFHRNHIQLVSSQVSTLAPHWRGRWTKSRRMQVALEQLTALDGSKLIRHHIPFVDAPKAYEMLDSHSAETVHTIFTY